MGCGFNRSMQHLVSKSREEDVADEEVPTEDSLHRSRPEHDVGPLAGIVAKQLQLQWSPRQIAGWLKRAYPEDVTYQVSHETIYRTLFIQARGALKKELLQHLRRTRRMRRSRHHTQKMADRNPG